MLALEEYSKERPTRQTPRRRRKHRGGNNRMIALVLITILLVGICTAGMFFAIFMKYVNTTLAPKLDVKAEDYTMNLSSVVYYQDKSSGEWVEFQKVHGIENRIWVGYDQMPDALWQAAVSIEDERFFSHKGVDWKRTIGAVLTVFTGNTSYGGSTITQQMLKNVTGENENTINRKILEIFRALRFEENYTKQQILELYLNNIYLGQSCYGVQTGAEYYFGKDVSELTAAECASLIAITNNPSLYGPKYNITYTRKDGTQVTPRELNKTRQGWILDKMAEVKDPETGKPYLTKEEAERYKAEELQFRDDSTGAEDIIAAAQKDDGVNNWFVEQMIKDVTQDLAEAKGISKEAARTMLNNGGYQIYSTMDPKIQAIAESVYENTENLNIHSPKGEQLQSGMTIIDPYTGNVAAMVGCVGPKAGNLWDNYAMQKHQVGSSIKPLTVYSAGLELGGITPATVFDNYPVRLLDESPWPKNSPNTYTGLTSIADGVRRSINTIAVQTLESTGVEAAFNYASNKLMLDLAAEDMAVSPIGLGGLTYGLNTMEMAAAYSVFPNSGVYNSPKMYLEIKDNDGVTVLSKESESHVAVRETTAYLMNELLKGVVESGTGTSARFGGMTIAGKTGTTNDSRDRYFVGYTPYYCAAVWTGYRTNEKISSSGNPSVTMWKKVMQKIHDDLPNRGFQKQPADLEEITVCADSGLLCTEACEADLRGSRSIQVLVEVGSAPTDLCTLHTLVDYCTVGKCIATDGCYSAGTVKQVGVLDLEREDYFTAEGKHIVADDESYTLRGMMRAIGLEPDLDAAGTEIYPEIIGCPIHSHQYAPTHPWGEPTEPTIPDHEPDPPSVPFEPTPPSTLPSEPEVSQPGAPSEPLDPDNGFF